MMIRFDPLLILIKLFIDSGILAIVYRVGLSPTVRNRDTLISRKNYCINIKRENEKTKKNRHILYLAF